MVREDKRLAAHGELKQKIQPEGCTIYFVPVRTGQGYIADFYTQDGTFMKTFPVVPVRSRTACLKACETLTRIMELWGRQRQDW